MNALDPIRILVVDDHADWCQTVSMVLELEPDLKVVGVEHHANDLAAAVARCTPAIVLIDISMPGREPLEALRETVLEHPKLRAVVLSGYDDPEARARAYAAGAVRFLTKGADPDQLIREVREAAALTPSVPRLQPTSG